MIRYSLAIHVSPEGKVSVLYSGTDAQAAYAAWKACAEPGKTYAKLNFDWEKSKRIDAAPVSPADAPADVKPRPPKSKKSTLA